jgi:hypothetical protein
MKQTRGKIYIPIYINVQEFNISKNCILKVYMHVKICMHEHFYLITNSFKYKCETSQFLYIHFKKL